MKLIREREIYALIYFISFCVYMSSVLSIPKLKSIKPNVHKIFKCVFVLPRNFGIVVKTFGIHNKSQTVCNIREEMKYFNTIGLATVLSCSSLQIRVISILNQ